MEKGMAAGHNVFVVKPSDCSIVINDGEAYTVSSRGERVVADVVIPRIPKNLSSYDRAILRQLESSGTYTLAGSLAIERSFDMVRTLQLLNKNKLSVPYTIIGREQAIPSDMLGRMEMPLALRSSSEASNTIITSNEKTAKSLLRAFSSESSCAILQEAASMENRREVHAVILGAVVVASMHTNKSGEHEPVKLSDSDKKVLTRVAKALNITFCSIDIILYNDGYVISKIDVNPKLEVIEQTTGRDVVSRLIQYIEQNVKRYPKKDKIGA